MLGTVGVLILIDQNILEIILVVFEHIWEIAEQDIGIYEQVVEIHCPSLIASVPVGLIDVGKHRTLGPLVILHQFAVGTIHSRGDEIVLGIAYLRLDAIGLVGLVIKPHLLDDAFDQAARVALVIDGEILLETESCGFTAQYPAEQTVESAHPQATRQTWTHKIAYSALHFCCRLLGKSKCNDLVGIVPVLQQIGDLHRENASLARSSTGYNKLRAIAIYDGLSLTWI